MELNTARIEDAIIAEVASKMIGDDELYARAKREIDVRINKLWSESAEDRIRQEIESAITFGFEHQYQKIDSFGRPAGEKTSIRAELTKMIGGYWNDPVGRDGKPSSGYGNVTRAEWLMAKMCADDFAGATKQHIVNVGGALKDAFRKELHATVNRMISEVFHVKSADDQATKTQTSGPLVRPPEIA